VRPGGGAILGEMPGFTPSRLSHSLLLFRPRLHGTTMPKKISRCLWAEGVSLQYIEYHDKEWGVPVTDDRTQFEFLILEGAQAGLSWSTVLNKRDGYRKNFAEFDPAKVARFTKKRIEKILTDPGIVRNRLKVESAVSNAQAFLEVQEEFGGFANYVWGFVDGKPKQNRFRRDRDIPATSKESDALSKDLKKRGFRFVGSTIVYAHMQATGIVNDHVTSCFRYKPCAELGRQIRL
jgi:DNA-3-methyladenine glycosylase I